jgi:hypothetical protein
MQLSKLKRLDRLESKKSCQDYEIVITEMIVDRDPVTDKLFVSYGYRFTVGQDGSKTFLPREHFKDVDPTPKENTWERTEHLKVEEKSRPPTSAERLQEILDSNPELVEILRADPKDHLIKQLWRRNKS